MQGDAVGRLTESEISWRAQDEATPPCGDAASCVCWPDRRVTVADIERMAEALGMRPSDLVA